MRANLSMLVIPAAFGVALAAAAGGDPSPAPKLADNDKVRRGEYLVLVGACHDCHTPMKMTPLGPAPDMELALSGHPAGAADPGGTLGPTDLALSGSDLTSWKQPFGVVYTRNLTPDKTGLGDWTEKQFVDSIRRGRHQGDGRPLLPPMPWMMYAHWTDDDVRAVYAYLRTLKPIKNVVADPKVPPPVFDQFVKVNEHLAQEAASYRARAQAK